MNRQPLLILVLCFILGIFFQDRFFLHKNAVYLVVGICSLLLGILFFHSYLLFKIKPFLLGLFFFGAGIVLHSFYSLPSESASFSKNEIIHFKILKKLNSTEKNKKYEAFVQVGNDYFNMILNVPKNYEELDFNHYYKAEAHISKPGSSQYDFQFNYAQYLKRKNIEYQCYLSKGFSSAIRNDLSLNENILQKRLEVLQDIDKSEMSAQSREFLKGIILADRTEIDAETVRDFNKSGLMHFLAISGTHIVVVFGLFYFILIRFISLNYRKYAVISSLIFIWLFACFIGFGNSVIRSCIMLTVYFIYVLLQRKPDLLHSLSLAAFVILIADTQQIFDIGFQLSFIAVLGIYWLNQPILQYFPKQNNYVKKLIFTTISISVSAQLATLPLVLYYFHQFSLMSTIANFVIVPFSEIIIVFSFLMTVLIAFKIDFGFINGIYDLVIQVLLKIIHWFADFDNLFFENISMNLIEVLLSFLIMYLMRFAILKFNFKNATKVTMAVLTFFIVRNSLNIWEHQKDEILIHDFYDVKVFSVKKGDRVCFWIKRDSDMAKVSEYIISPYISSRRVNVLEIKTFPSSAQRVVYDEKIFDIN